MKLFGHEFGKPKGENSPEGAAVDGGMGANPSQMAELEKVRAANAAETASTAQATSQEAAPVPGPENTPPPAA